VRCRFEFKAYLREKGETGSRMKPGVTWRALEPPDLALAPFVV